MTRSHEPLQMLKGPGGWTAGGCRAHVRVAPDSLPQYAGGVFSWGSFVEC